MRTIEIGIASISDDVLSVSVDYHHEASPLVKKWHSDRSVVNGICRDIEEAVADAISEPDVPSKSDESSEILDRLRSLGLALFQELLKDECDRLRDLRAGPESGGAPDGVGEPEGVDRQWDVNEPGDGSGSQGTEGPEISPEGIGGTYLVFKIDKSLAYLPLELMYDGTAFLSRRFAVGRVIYAESAGVRGASRRRPPYAVLIIGDPSKDTRISRDVEDEIDMVRDVFRGTGDYSPRIAIGDEVDLKYILSNLPGTSVFHFSGHGVVSQDEQQTGLKLASGGILSGYSLQGLQDAPVFAFLNVCTPASRETWKGSLGIIETLLRRGTRACMSSLWEVRSKAAAILASHFYEHLLAGRTFGEALRLARIATAAEAGPHDPTWAAYALYGDPRLRLLEKAPQGRAAALSRGAGMSRRAAIFTAFALVGVILIVGMFLSLPPAPRAPDTLTESTGTPREPVAGVQAEPGQAVGYLVIESTPRDANILMDGKHIGLTPCAAEVPVGMHEVVLEKQGYRRWEASVEVKASSRATVTAALERIK